MANNYCQLSTCFTNTEKDAAEWLVAEFKKHDGYNPEELDEEENGDEDMWTGTVVDYHIPSKDLYLYCEENGNLEMIGGLLAMWQKHFPSVPKRIVITFSLTCSKMRPDEFSGGAILIENGKYDIKNATDLFPEGK